MPGRISRGRGYSYEHYLDKWVNSLPEWYCRRLGGSSTNMPDLLCINNTKSTLVVTECKSLMTEVATSVLYIPKDQVQRCIDFIEIFQVYKKREVVFSFKFGRGYGKSYYFTLEPVNYDQVKWEEILYVRCTYDGKCKMVMHSPPEDKYFVDLKPRQNLITK